MTHLAQAEALNKPATHPAAGTIHCIIEHLKEQRQFGLWQVCPKCEGEGEVLDKLSEEEDPPYCTCPVCNGAKLLVRPEIKTNNP